MSSFPSDGLLPQASGGAAPLLSILIVAFNSRSFIEDCIGSVIEHTTPGTYEILLVDNGKDDTAGLVAERFPSVRIVPSQGNIGFGRGNNLLAEHARGEFLLLLNPDTRLLDPAIDRLLSFARSQAGAAWGGLSTLPDGTLHGANFQAIPTPRGILRGLFGTGAKAVAASFSDRSGARRVEVLSGGFMLISRAHWEALGGFDPSFLLYSEEVDLFTRLRKMGGEVWLYPESRIIHDIGGGAGYSPARQLYLHTGLMHYARRHWGWPSVQLVGAAYWLVALRRWIVSLALSVTSELHRSRHRALRRIVMRPRSWWRGYEGRSSLD